MIAMRFERAFAGSAVVFAALVAALLTSGSTPQQGRATLARLAAAGGYRTVEPRLSFDTQYAPFRLSAVDRARRGKLLALTGREHEGLAHLLAGDTATAADTLSRSGSADPIDITAAHYMQGLRSGSLTDFGRALQSLSSVPASAAATFNHALILEQLSDAEAAAAEWKNYLSLDPSSSWAAEARRHLDADSQPAVAQRWRADKGRLTEAAGAGDEERVRKLVACYPLGARQVVELELLPAWGRAWSLGDAAAAEHALGAARHCAAALEQNGDHLSLDAVAEIDEARDAPKLALAKAYGGYAAGHDALEKNDLDRVLALDDEALQLGGRFPAFAALVVDDAVTARYRKFDNAGAQALIDGARAKYARRSGDYVALFARLDWLEGAIDFVRGDMSESMRVQTRSLALYSKLRETEYVAAQHVNLASTFVYLGEIDRAAVHLKAAMVFASRAEDPRRMFGALKVAADWALEANQPATALVFQDRFVRVARASGEPVRIADALVNRSSVLVRAGRRAEALRDVAEVDRLAEKITDLPSRKRIGIDARISEAFALRDTDGRAEIASLTRCLELMRELEFPMKRAQLLLERGRAHLRLADTNDAEADFRAGIDELEQQRRMIKESELRVTYFDRADRLFVDLALLLVRRGRPEEAFDMLERLRSRELLDLTSDKPVMPMRVAEIRARLPQDTVMVSYTIAGTTLITCVLTREGVRAFERAGSESASPAHLLDGIDIAAGTRIAFVPDPALSSVPFAALRSADGRYLVEDHTLVVAPSATLYVRNCERGRRMGTRGAPSLFAVASPQRPRGFDDLQPLTRATSEVQRIARGYANARTVIAAPGDQPESLLVSARGFDVVHFAAHSVVDNRTPARSALLIGETGRITAAEIEAAGLSNVRLVVLGGCNTGIGKSHSSEGSMSLARAFMVAGVPTVIGTVAPIEDAAAERLLTRFHEAYRGGLDAATALRRAQLQVLQSGSGDSDPANWAAFEVIGGADAPDKGKERAHL